MFEVAHRWVVRSNKRQNPLIRLFFCVKADGLAAKLTPERDLSMTVLGWPRVLRCCLNFTRLSSNVVFEDLVLSSLIASPLLKPFFAHGGWRELKCVY